MDPNIFPEGHPFKGCDKKDFEGTDFTDKIAIVAHGDCSVRLDDEIIIHALITSISQEVSWTTVISKHYNSNLLTHGLSIM